MAFSYYSTITIDRTKCGASDSTDFPILVSGTYTDLKTVGNGGFVQNANGYDIGFYSDSGLTTKLAWETESYNASTGAVIYWVKVPTLSVSADTVIYMAFGDASISTDQSDKTGTWDSNFQLVYHLSDGSTLSANDSTSNARNGTTTGTPTATTGQIDGAAEFSGGGANDRINTPYTGNPTDFTVSAWINPSDNSQYRRALDKTYNGGFWMGYDGTNGVGWGGGIQQTAAPYGIFLPASTGVWTYLTMRRSNITYTLLKDGGASTNSAVVSNSALGADVLYIGHTSAQASNEEYSGKIDEVRFSNVARSDSWILAEYNSMASPSTFYSVGTKQSVGGGGGSTGRSLVTTPVRGASGSRSASQTRSSVTNRNFV